MIEKLLPVETRLSTASAIRVFACDGETKSGDEKEKKEIEKKSPSRQIDYLKKTDKSERRGMERNPIAGI